MRVELLCAKIARKPACAGIVCRRMVLIAAVMGVMTGCREEPQVRHVRVAAMGEPAESQPSRMIGAIVPRPAESQAWFFKMTGNPDAVQPRKAEFEQLLESLDFAQPAKPNWKLPDGWTQKPGEGMRFATLVYGEGKDQLEMSVMALPMSDPADDVLRNVNRWRDQLKLAAIEANQLAETTEKLEVGDNEVIVVDLTGESTGQSMTGNAPFAGSASPLAAGAGQMPAGHPPISSDASKASSNGAAGSGTPSSPPPSPIEYQKPANWEPGDVRGIRVAAFRVPDGERFVEVTVIPMALVAGDVLSNVNIWRGQLGLDSTTQEQLSDYTETVDVNGQAATFVELLGNEQADPRQAILAAILPRADAVWFFKAIGDADSVQKEKTNFLEFIRSVKFKEGI